MRDNEHHLYPQDQLQILEAEFFPLATLCGCFLYTREGIFDGLNLLHDANGLE